jgi:CRISPR system Cascade subunit CasB
MTQPYIPYYRLHDDQLRETVYNWWARLAGLQADGETPNADGAARAERAVLRRARSPDDAMLSEGFRRLWFELPANERSPRWMPDWASVAVVLSNVRRHRPDKSFAASLGERPDEHSDKPVFSELRFRQLQQSRSPEELTRRLQRAVHLLRETAHVVSLADNIIQWHREYAGNPARRPEERLAVRWAQAYFDEIQRYQHSA